MTLIKRYSDWLNEAAEPAQPAQTSNSVALISAASDATPLGAKKAAEIGVKENTVYTIKTTLAGLHNLGRAGKYSNLNQLTIDQGTPGTGDTLEINGKAISGGRGSVEITKAEAGAGLTIKASGNGLATLIRAGAALEQIWTLYKVPASGLSDWALKLSLGGDPKVDASRGYTFSIASPAPLKPSGNGLATVISMMMLKAAGKEGNISQEDAMDKKYYDDYIKDKDSVTTFNQLVTAMSKGLLRINCLVNQTPGDATATLSRTLQSPQSYMTAKGSIMALNAQGVNQVKAIISDVADALAPTEMPGGFSQSTSVLGAYNNAIKAGLTSANISSQFENVQVLNQYGTAKPTGGTMGSGQVKQGSGQFK